MTAEAGLFQPLSLKGEVIEILERQGRTVVKVRVENYGILDVDSERLRGAHLGDSLKINALVVIEGVQPEWLPGEEHDENIPSGSDPG